MFVANGPFKKLNEIDITSQGYEVDHSINSNCLYINITSNRGVQKSDSLDPTHWPHPTRYILSLSSLNLHVKIL